MKTKNSILNLNNISLVEIYFIPNFSFIIQICSNCLAPTRLFYRFGVYSLQRTSREEKPVPFSKSLRPPFNFLSHWPIFHTISIRSWRSWAEKLYFCVGAHSEWEKLTPFSSNLSTMVLNRSCFWLKSLLIFWGALSQLGLSSTTQMHSLFQSQV